MDRRSIFGVLAAALAAAPALGKLPPPKRKSIGSPSTSIKKTPLS